MVQQPLNAEVRSIIDEVIKYINQKFSGTKAKLLTDFAWAYYGGVALEDLIDHSIENLFGLLYSHWQLLAERKKGELKIEIFNPTVAKNGWSSSHTIVQLITDDMPFLVDSLRMKLAREGYNVYFMIHLGGLKFRRDAKNQVTEVLSLQAPMTEGVYDEAPIFIEIDHIADDNRIAELKKGLISVLHDVRMAVEDWGKMRLRLQETIQEFETIKFPQNSQDINEARDFLCWIENNHFTFLGCRDYVIIGEDENTFALKLIDGSGLGILRDESTCKKIRPLSSLPPAARKMALSDQVLIISKTNTKSTVHRPAYTDYIGIKRYDENGKVVGERRYIGLYTSTAYNSNPKHIPFLRHKVEQILQKSGLLPRSHAGKTLQNILETLPRDDLFQADIEELTKLSLGILRLQERAKIRLFPRWDVYRRFISMLVYIPREWVNTDLIQQIRQLIKRDIKVTEIDHNLFLSESSLARIHFLVRVDPEIPQEIDFKKMDAEIAEIGRPWIDGLRACLVERYGEVKGLATYHRYAKAFPSSYRDDFTARSGMFDIEEIEKITAENPLGMSFYRPVNDASGIIRFKLFHHKDTIALSDILPMLENMGLRVINERPYQILPADSTPVWINDFSMTHVKGTELNVSEVKNIFQEAFAQVWWGKAENDGFNRLVLAANLTWHEITILRAIAKYLRQAGFTFSQSYLEETMVKNAEMAKILVDLFNLKFNPVQVADAAQQMTALEAKLKKLVDGVSNLDEDRIIRRYLAVIHAMLRTNYYQLTETGQVKDYLSIKFDSNLVPELPLPRPLYEVFVYSPRFEGIHLRSAKVARGGLRWSDRREDFRTEVLGLMKAQKVKNAVIVPSGAKGGFVPKLIKPEATREEVSAEGIACYKQFISGLLDITDNLVKGEVVPPKEVVRIDGDDPYLVVAADKGTATFSDIANEIALNYGFWLGDAFASGGRTGYDHKKMAITARGAWVSAERHFRELGIDIQTTDFTVIGIGDMSGDVFGNGMLLSRHIKLVAAFNHMHIFLDPDPNPETSFVERERLFNLPRSGWADYNPELISKGGGVFLRSAKSIPLSPEVQNLLDFHVELATPNEIIWKILQAKVELLFNGGIGTYIKAPQETHAEVGDRTNDAVRVNATELRCRVIVEGGNLGVTQLGRICYELNGGIINTDFIDNSAGVDCSDHEVNIKILLNQVMAEKKLTEEGRNKLLAEMTDEVAALVLRDNYAQTQELSLEKTHAYKDMELYSRYIIDLEQKGKLDRAVEFLPDVAAIKERKIQGVGLTRPEIAVLLAYSKIVLKEEVLASTVPEEPYFTDLLATAFPARLSKSYSKEMQQHSLRREIIATQIGNSVIDEMGVTFIYRLRDETGAPASAVVRAYMVARMVFDLQVIWHQIEALDLKVPAALQLSMMYDASRLVRHVTRWFLRHRRAGLPMQETIEYFKPRVTELEEKLPKLLVGSSAEKLQASIAGLTAQGVPAELAQRVANCKFLLATLDIIEASNDHNPSAVASMYFALGERLDLSWFREQITSYPVETHWDAVAREALRDELDVQQRTLSISVLQHKSKAKNLKMQIESWIDTHFALVERWQRTLTELRAMPVLNYVMISVAVRELQDLTQTSRHFSKATM